MKFIDEADFPTKYDISFICSFKNLQQHFQIRSVLTTVGDLLARRLMCPLYDLDKEIERHFGESIERLKSQFSDFTPDSGLADLGARLTVETLPGWLGGAIEARPRFAAAHASPALSLVLTVCISIGMRRVSLGLEKLHPPRCPGSWKHQSRLLSMAIG